MGSGLFTIIILIAVVWQIISVIVAHAQQQKQKQAEAEARRQRALSGAGDSRGRTPPTQATSSGVADRGAQPKMSKLDELAARRQQQLEELRRRRQSSGRPPTGVSESPGRATSRVPRTRDSGTEAHLGQSPGLELPIELEPRSAPSGRMSRGASPGQSHRTAQDQQRLARQKQQQQQQLSRRRGAEAEARRLADTERTQAARTAGTGDVIAAGSPPAGVERDAYRLSAPAIPDEAVSLNRVQHLLHHRATLRELIVMKEVLDPPVGMREPGGF